jgi:hypothetical protein
VLHLINYLSVWVAKEARGNANLEAIESDLVITAEHLINILRFSNALNYSTLPDIRFNISSTNSKDLLARLDNGVFLPNGGIFFVIIKLLTKLFLVVSKSENKNAMINMLYSMFYLEKNLSNSRDTSSDLIHKIEKANMEYLKLFKAGSQSKCPEGYFETTLSEKSIRPSVIIRYFVLWG